MATLTTTINYSEPAGSIITALGVPGPAGPGVPIGGAAGQILAKIDSADYNTHWVTPEDDAAVWGQITGQIANQLDLASALSLKLDVSTAASTYQPISGMSAYLTKAGNLAGLTDLVTARDNLALGLSNQVTFTSVIAETGTITAILGSQGNNGLEVFDANSSVIVQTTGIVFPDASVQVTAYTGDNVVSWGEIQGQIVNQLDLQSALNGKYPTTNPAGYIDSSALAPYLLSSTAASTYAVFARGLPSGGVTAQVLTKADNTDYSSTWTTIIPGDRYLTSSTTPNTIGNGAKTFAVQTGLSYTPTQDVTISYDPNNHMHAVVTSYDTATGLLVVNVNHHTGSGTYSSWVVNVGGTVPAQSVAWGSITGVISAQLDLQAALDTKLNTTTAASTYYPLTNPAGYIDASALAPYLTSATAASTYQTLSGMSAYLTTASAASTYFTISSAAGKANLSGATFTGKVNLATISAASPGFNIGGQCDPAPASAVNGDLWISNAASPKLTYRAVGVNYNLAVLNQFNTFTGQVVIDTTSSTTAALRVTQKGTGNAIQVEDSTTPDATPFVVDQFGKVGVGVSPDTTAALKVDTNGIMFGDGTVQTTAATTPPPSWSPTPTNVGILWLIQNYTSYVTSVYYDSGYNWTVVYHNLAVDTAIRTNAAGLELSDGSIGFAVSNTEQSGQLIFNGDLTTAGPLYAKIGTSYVPGLSKYFV